MNEGMTIADKISLCHEKFYRRQHSKGSSRKSRPKLQRSSTRSFDLTLITSKSFNKIFFYKDCEENFQISTCQKTLSTAM